MADNIVTATISLGVNYTNLSWMHGENYKFIYTLNCSDRGVLRGKEPASVLIQSDGITLESFGYDAEEKYSELRDNGTQNDWYYFERFWTELNEHTVFLEATRIKDKSGKEIQVVNVISILIKCLLQRLGNLKTFGSFGYKNIHLILTVPANWNTDMKNLMKLAVKKTGLDVGNLSIVLESEAAAFYCLHPKSIVNSSPPPQDQGNHTIPGTWEPFIICDFQEDKLAMNLHMMTSDMQLKHIITEHDSTLRVSNLNEEFETFINTLAGCEAVSVLKMHHMDEYKELMEDFRKKACCLVTKSDRVAVLIPIGLSLCVRDLTGKTFKEQIANSMYNNEVSMILTTAWLRIKTSVFVSLFDSFVTRAVDRIRTFISKHCAMGIKHILIVSELALPKPLEQGVTAALSDMHVFIPFQPETAVLQGALIWGRELRL